MARDISVSMSLIFNHAPFDGSLLCPVKLFDVAGHNFIHNSQNVGVTEEALLLGDVTVGGWFAAINRHATATISIRQGTGAADLIDLGPGEPCLFRLSTDATAPYVISTVAGAELEYILVDL